MLLLLGPDSTGLTQEGCRVNASGLALHAGAETCYLWCRQRAGTAASRAEGRRRRGLNERDRIWAEWLLGVFGTAGLFAILAGVGMGAQGTKMGWLSYVLGAFAFAVAPYFAVRIRPRRLTGGVLGLGMA